MKKKIILLLAGIIFSTQIFVGFNILGRSPAVLPVGGISIEEYKESKPEDDKGYNFKQRSKIDGKNKDFAYKNVTTLNPLNQKEGLSLWFLFIIALLPLGVWFGIYHFAEIRKKELKKSPPTIPVFLKKQDDDDDDDDDDDKHDDDHHDDDNFKKVS